MNGAFCDRTLTSFVYYVLYWFVVANGEIIIGWRIELHVLIGLEVIIEHLLIVHRAPSGRYINLCIVAECNRFTS